jgi:hypothetical protein
MACGVFVNLKTRPISFLDWVYLEVLTEIGYAFFQRGDYIYISVSVCVCCKSYVVVICYILGSLIPYNKFNKNGCVYHFDGGLNYLFEKMLPPKMHLVLELSLIVSFSLICLFCYIWCRKIHKSNSTIFFASRLSSPDYGYPLKWSHDLSHSYCISVWFSFHPTKQKLAHSAHGVRLLQHFTSSF